MRSSVGQLSAVAAMLQFSSNKQGTICEINRLVTILPSVAHSKERKLWVLTPIRPGGGGLRGPDDQTHSCQSKPLTLCCPVAGGGGGGGQQRPPSDTF